MTRKIRKTKRRWLWRKARQVRGEEGPRVEEEVEIPRGGSGGIGAAGGCLLPLLLSLLLLLLLLVALCMSPWPRGREEVAGSGVRNGSSGRERWSFMPTSTWCCSDKSGEGGPASTTRVGS